MYPSTPEKHYLNTFLIYRLFVFGNSKSCVLYLITTIKLLYTSVWTIGLLKDIACEKSESFDSPSAISISGHKSDYPHIYFRICPTSLSLFWLMLLLKLSFSLRLATTSSFLAVSVHLILNSFLLHHISVCPVFFSSVVIIQVSL